MKYKLVALIVFSLALAAFETPNTLALQSGVNGIDLPCGASGVLFTNAGPRPTAIDLGADWSGPCALTLSWTDAGGNARRMTLVAPSNNAVSSSQQPSSGAASSLATGGSISWSTAAGTRGSNLLNVTLERPPDVQPPIGPISATFGSVGGKFGSNFSGTNTGENVACGSSGTLYTDMTTATVGFDLMIHNESPTIFINNVPNSCSVTVSWTDANGHTQKIAVSQGHSEGVSATSLPGEGAVFWTSSGPSSAQVAVEWKEERSTGIKP